MRYRKQEIIESDIMDAFTTNEIVRRTGFNISYVSRVKSGKLVASYRFFQKLQEVLTNL